MCEPLPHERTRRTWDKGIRKAVVSRTTLLSTRKKAQKWDMTEGGG